jgi:hypothetical protein
MKMATFQDIRQFLELHHDDLVRSLPSNEQDRFRSTFERLQRDWDRISEEQVKLDVTIGEMHKHPPVWRALEEAHLVPPGQSPSIPPLPASVSHVEAESGYARSAHSPKEREDSNRGQPSQQVVDRLAIWDKRIFIGREFVTNVLGALIVLVTLAIAIITILSVGNASTYAAGKDVLLFMNGLVGVVLGYYFGRAPGDARAAKAESDARTANSDRDRVVATVRTVLESSGASGSRGPSGATLTPEQVESLRRILYRYGSE